jgi:soluble lytic murein transglycosylase
MRIWALVLGWTLCGPAGAGGAPPEAPGPAEASASVVVPEDLRHLAVALPPEVRAKIQGRAWAEAATAVGALPAPATVVERHDLAFLQGWLLLQAGRAVDAAPLMPLMDDVSTAPLAYRALLRSEIAQAQGDTEAALAELARVPDDALLVGRAAAQRAELAAAAGRLDEARAVLAPILARPDPAEGNAAALAVAARLAATAEGPRSEEAYRLWRRLWMWYPGGSEGSAASDALALWTDRGPTPAERVQRAERWMDLGSHDLAITALAPLAGALSTRTPEGCRAAYIRGRSYYKKNLLTEALAAFGDAGVACASSGVAGDVGARVLYLVGTAQYRRNLLSASADSFSRIADLYPTSSMADDGLAKGGISAWEAGDHARAMTMWARALDAFSGGDMAPEASFRLAFAHYLEGRPSAAIEVFDRLGALDPRADWFHVLAGVYWSARLRYYPDVADPRRPTQDMASREDAIARWRRLVEAYPQNYYALLAYSRLVEVAPHVAAELQRRPPEGEGFGDWSVRRSFFVDPRVGTGVALARLGLVTEALVEWGQADLMAAEPEEVAWLQELRADAGDWLGSHKWMQQYLRAHPVGTLGPREAQIVALSYPDRYWDEVVRATQGFAYAPRMFHALVREESGFDKNIVSFAGAEGLSQVMPATAREVAGWLGRSLAPGQMFDPVTNLTLGGRYLQSVYQSQSQNPFLAMASYNGGPARIGGWVTAWNNPPLDEYVERIPVKETRDYVKKVSTTWQVMRFAFDRDEPPFLDLSKFNHAARP